jgi:hypothetical protein
VNEIRPLSRKRSAFQFLESTTKDTIMTPIINNPIVSSTPVYKKDPLADIITNKDKPTVEFESRRRKPFGGVDFKTEQSSEGLFKNNFNNFSTPKAQNINIGSFNQESSVGNNMNIGGSRRKNFY